MKIHGTRKRVLGNFVSEVKIRRVHQKNQTYSKPHGKPIKAYDRKKERQKKTGEQEN